MSNFRFLAEEWPDIAREARDAERFVQVSPTASAVFARKALERAVRWMFENDGAFEYPYDRQLSALMNADSFRREVPPALHRELHLIRKVGNSAAHDKRIVVTQSVASIQYLFRFLKWFGRLYSVGDLEVPPFDEAHIQPKAKPKDVPTLAQLQDLQQRYDAERTRAEEERKERLKAEEERQKLQAELDQVKARKEKHAQLPLPEAPYTEQETRRQFIDEMLREAGWDPEGANVAEYPVQG
ncbi:MAG: DUF4145 domain-containing protein, partial [Flavobacteriales bacterium]|nr:DUF4145 domain-containing protein [Flavobacteriales bacterium]